MRRAIITCGAALASALAHGATGQSATSESGGAIETIIVTAQKRSEDLQTVPIATSVMTGAQLESEGVVGFPDLGLRIPSLRFGSGVTGGENVITLRGIGSQNTTSGGDSPVAYSVDGVYLARTTAVDPEFFDIERVEVLRGPQGTLYGRNSVGGSVNVITRKPDDTFGAYADAMAGNYDGRIFRGWVNVPLETGAGTRVLARITGVKADHDAYQSNLSNAPTAKDDADAQDFYLLRAHVLIDFSDDLSLLLSATRNENKDPVATKLGWGYAPVAAQARFAGLTYESDKRKVHKAFPERFDQTNEIYSGTLNWNLGFAELTSITAYTQGDWKQTNDADSVDLDLAHMNYWTLDSDQFSQEVRLASTDAASPLSWIVGGFYFREKLSQGFQFVDTGLNAPPGTGFVFTNGGDYETKSWAAFGQVDYDLAQTGLGVPITLTAGLRYTRDEKSGDDFLHYVIPDFAFDLFLSKDFNPDWSEVTGKLGLSYQMSDDVMLYGNVSSGYLSGGGLVGNFPGLYDPEKVWNYEAGLKSRLLDDTLQVNAAAFYTRIDDMQVFVQDITGSRIDNAGKAHVTGIELEAVAVPTANLRLNAALSLMQAEYDSYTTIDNRYAGSPPVSFDGNRLVQTPKHTLDVGVQYTIETGVGTLTPRVDSFWSGDLYFLSANSRRDRQDAYVLTNVSVDWKDPSERWTVTGFVRNVSDEDVISNDGLQSNTLGLGFGIDNYTYYPPRTYGLRVGVEL